MRIGKKLITACALGALSSFALADMSAQVPVGQIFSPAGFDSDDHAEVIVMGYLPNLCYKAPKAKAEVDGKKIKLKVSALKNVRSLYCPQVIVPFMEIVQLGVLDKGKYDIVANEDSEYQKNSNMLVKEAVSDATDPDIFANVSNVEKIGMGRKIVLKGYNPSDCFELKKVEFIDNGIDTYTVLPKLKQLREFCPKKEVPFSYEVEVPKKLVADRILLHVKVMDGKSVNTLFKNPPLDD